MRTDGEIYAQAVGEWNASGRNPGTYDGVKNVWVAQRAQELRALEAGPAGNKNFTKTVSQMPAEEMLRARPELRPYYEQAKQQFRQYVDAGGGMKIPNYAANAHVEKNGQTYTVEESKYAKNADELAWNWLYGHVINLGVPGMGVEVKPLERTTSPTEFLEAQYDANAEKNWWQRIGQPGLAQGLQFASIVPGLNPIGALAKGLGTALGSKIAGQALAGAAGAAITGGDPLRGGLSAIAGGLSGKFSDALGAKTGGAIAGGLSSLAAGGNPARGFAAGYLGGGVTKNNANGGGGDMGGVNLKDVLAPAVLGALLNSASAGTGAASGAALGLLGSTGFGGETSGLEGVLNSALQGYLVNKLQGGNGGQGALAGAGNSIYKNYVANGTNDDVLRAALGLQGLSGAAGGYLDSIVSGDGQGAGVNLEQLLRNKINELMDKYLGGGSTAASGFTGTADTSYQLPDIMSLYRNYYNQLPATGGGNYDAVLKSQYDAANGLMNENYLKESGKLDADLNRRGLYSSGIALSRQDELRNQLMNALSREAGQTALSISNMQADAQKQRSDQAMEFAKLRLSELMKNPALATPAELSGGYGAAPVAAVPQAGIASPGVWPAVDAVRGSIGLPFGVGADNAGDGAGAANFGTGAFGNGVFSSSGTPSLFSSPDNGGQRLFPDVVAKFKRNPVFSYGAGSTGSQLVFK